MVQGLGFLSKKSWHTKNLANQEKVWIAEQRKEEEERRTHELAKQIQQEREQEELAKIAGKSSSQYDRGIDWMYNHGQECAKEDAVKEQEEYLLGKAIGSEARFVKGDLAAAAEEEGGVNKLLAQQKKQTEEEKSALESKPAAAMWSEPSVAEKNEAFRQRVEDPMFAVMQKSREMERAAENKAKLYEKVTGKTVVLVARPVDDDDEDGDHKVRKRKADKKRKSKHKKKHSRRRRDYSSDSSDDSYRRPVKHTRTRSRSRSRSPRRDEKYHSRRHHTPSPVDRHGKQPLPRTDGNDHNFHLHNSREHGRGDRRGDFGRTHNGDGYFGRRHGEHGNEAYIDMKQSRRNDNEGSRYGLQGSTAQSSSDLGPDSGLLRKRRDEKEAEARLRKDGDRRRHMTSDERAAALQNMQQDAVKRRGYAKERPHSHVSDECVSRGRASFLSDLTRQTNGINDAGMSLDERLKQSRNTSQRSHEKFL